MSKARPFETKTLEQINKICLKMKLPYLRIFGSSVLGLKNARDVDLVLATRPKKFSEYSKLVSSLETIFAKKVDLIFLDQISNPRLVLEILAHSKMLFSTTKGLELFATTADRLHGLATDEVLRFPLKEQIKNMNNISRRLLA